MADYTTTRTDGSQVELGGPWGDVAQKGVEAGLTFDPTHKKDVQVEWTDIPQIVQVPQEAVINPAVDEIVVTPATANIDVSDGTTQQLTVTDSNGVVVTDLATYESSDPTKATVNGDGLVSPVAAGSTTVTATYMGRTDTCVVTVAA